MATDYDITRPPVDAPPSDIGKPDAVEVTPDPYAGVQDVDKKYWRECLDDAERTEQDWRKRAREIIQIYRNESPAGRNRKSSETTFNILYSNTEVMAPAIYQRPPKPLVRSRFTAVEKPPMPMPMPGMLGMPPGMPSIGGPPPPPAASGFPIGGPPPMPMPPAPPNLSQPIMPPPMPPMGGPPPMGMPAPPPSLSGAGGVGMPPMPPPMPLAATMGQLPAGPSKPLQSDIETAASVVQKALEIVVDDENSNEAIKMAIKDVLLPGRGLCRVRWKPEMVEEKNELPGGPLPDGTAPVETTQRKVWEETCDEYVYWEDFLCDPTRSAADTEWIAFRHLFTEKQLDLEFADSPQYAALKQANRLQEIMRWTEESAAKAPIGGGSAMKTARNLGDHVKKAMLWEIWDRSKREVIWFCRDAGGLAMRVDPDTYQLKGFYPCPLPLLAVTTTDSRIPRPYYDLYAKLAADLDETSNRISQLTKKIKARGAYNGASRDIADILVAEDGKMIPVDGVDMLNGGLQNHIWMLPIDVWVQCLQQLYQARDQIKQAIYEIMGISDIMRGATKATETATAQRIKGSMGMGRLEDQKAAAATFARDLLRLKAELICQNFDAETLAQMTGEDVTPSVMSILRDDFMRTCLVDIESDSTVVPDMQAEQQGIAMVMQAVQMVMQGVQGMLMTQIMPPDKVIQLGLELLKMALHPVPYSRGVTQLIADFQKQMQAMPPMPMPMPPPPGAPAQGAPPDKPGVPGVGPPPGRPNIPPSGVSRPNGGPPPAPQMNV